MTDKIKKILVPVGFSEQSLKALDQAVLFAKTIKAEIVLLSVVETNGFWKKLFGKERDEAALKVEAMNKLTEIIGQYESQGVFIDPMIGIGEVDEEIARVAEMIQAELVVMGTNGSPANFNKKILGSNAYRVVRSVEAPVITLKGNKASTEIKSIAFPIMLDRKSKEKVGECIHWARLFGAEVKIIAVTNSKEELQKLTPHVNQVAEFMEEHGIACTKEIMRAEGKSTPLTVVEYCETIKADLLIIMEDEQPSAIRVGVSEVQEVLYNAEMPVMCVTPKPSKFAVGFQAI